MSDPRNRGPYMSPGLILPSTAQDEFAAYAARAAAADAANAPSPAAYASAPASGSDAANAPGSDAWAAYRAKQAPAADIAPHSMYQSAPVITEQKLESEAPKALELFKELADAKAESYAASRAFDEDRRVALMNFQRTRGELKRIGDHFQRHVFRAKNGEEPEEITTARARVAKHKAEMDRLEARAAPHQVKAAAIGRTLNRINRYFDRTRGAVKDVPMPKPGKSATLESLTATIQNIRADLDEIESRPWPAADAKMRAKAELDYIAQFGRISVDASVSSRGPLSWPYGSSRVGREIIVRGFGRNFPHREEFEEQKITADTALAVWANYDAILAKIYAEIDEIASPEFAMSADDRAAARAKLHDQLLTEERTLAAIIWRDSAHDLWPETIDPRAVLSLDGPAPAESI